MHVLIIGRIVIFICAAPSAEWHGSQLTGDCFVIAGGYVERRVGQKCEFAFKGHERGNGSAVRFRIDRFCCARRIESEPSASKRATVDDKNVVFIRHNVARWAFERQCAQRDFVGSRVEHVPHNSRAKADGWTVCHREHAAFVVAFNLPGGIVNAGHDRGIRGALSASNSRICPGKLAGNLLTVGPTFAQSSGCPAGPP